MALIPKVREEMVSSICLIEGPTLIIKAVLQLPPKESCNNLVNLLSLKGTNPGLFSDNALIHFPKADKEELIAFASCSLSPVDLDFLTLSDPAKSTMYKTEETIASFYPKFY